MSHIVCVVCLVTNINNNSTTLLLHGNSVCAQGGVNLHRKCKEVPLFLRRHQFLWNMTGASSYICSVSWDKALTALVLTLISLPQLHPLQLNTPPSLLPLVLFVSFSSQFWGAPVLYALYLLVISEPLWKAPSNASLPIYVVFFFKFTFLPSCILNSKV